MPIAAGDATYRHLAWFMTPLPENIADVIIHIAIQYKPSPNPLHLSLTLSYRATDKKSFFTGQNIPPLSVVGSVTLAGFSFLLDIWELIYLGGPSVPDSSSCPVGPFSTVLMVTFSIAVRLKTT